MVVALVMPPSNPRGRRRLLESVAEQTRLPDSVQVLEPGGRGRASVFAEALGHRDAHHEWFWLLDGAAIPATDALERLLAPLQELGPLPPPVLLASKVVDATGVLDPGRAPWPRLLQKEVSLDACERHLVSVRAARHGSLLMHRRALERHGPPRADYVDDGEDLEWTARVLRTESGYLVPGSRAVRLDAALTAQESNLRRRRDLRNRVNTLRGSAWGGEEKLWFAFLVAQDVVTDLRCDLRPATLRATLGAVRAGLRLPSH